MSRRDGARRRVTGTSDRVRLWMEAEHSDSTLTNLAVRLYRRDQDAFASVLGSAIALRLFLYMVSATLAMVGLVSLTHTQFLFEDALESSVTTGALVESNLDSSFWQALWLTLSGLAATLWAGRSLTRVLATCSAAAWRMPAPEFKVRTRLIVMVTLLFLAFTFASRLISHVDEVGGIVIGVGSWLAVLALITTGFFALSYMLPGPGTDPGALLPGVTLFAAGFSLVQWFMQIYLPSRIERSRDTLGDLAVAVSVLGYFYVVGRLMASSFVLNAIIHEHFGSISDVVFRLPVLRRMPARWPRLGRFFELEGYVQAAAQVTDPQPPNGLG